MYQKVDVIVCPSMEDPLPVVMTEGMMFYKPCIASDATGTAEFIADGENGFVVRAGDPIDLAEKMEWFINNKKNICTMGQAARRVYEENFRMENFGARLENAIKEDV